jgi:hypothetical protein
VRQRVDRSHLGRARRPQHLDEQQPDRPAPGHQRGSTQPQVTQVGRVDGHPQRLEHRAVGVGQRLR